MDSLNTIIGRSPVLETVLFSIEKASKSNSNVIILGESGVGKGLTAKAIHNASDRKNYPFIKINSLNIDANLIESELFGHRKGAFTGAHDYKVGLIESANGGTFFFDEIGDISPSLQGKLLSVIEDQEVRRIGENIFRKINTRFIFATNRNLFELVAIGKFRKDLFYRINIITIEIPPLRERISDIPLLINYFLKLESENRNRNISITRDAVNKLTNYHFPGNIRELENIIKRAIDYSNDNIIQDENIIFHNNKSNVLKRNSKYSASNIIDVLVKSNGNKSKAAKELGISRVHLYRLLNALNK